MDVKGEKRNFVCVWKGQKPTPEDIEQILADHQTWIAEEYQDDHYWRDPGTGPPHDLSRTDLSGANLEWANLDWVRLEKANLRDTHMEGALLRNACLKRAFFHKTHLELADLSGAHLEKADLSGVHLEEADLSGVHLEEADLSWAHLERTQLMGSNLSETFLVDAHLEEASLFDTNMENAFLLDAHLEGANLRGTDLSKAVVNGVKYDRRITCLGIRADTCYGSPMFKRHVQDLDFLEEFQSKHPVWYRLWWLLSDCGRSFLVWALWSLLFSVLFGLIFWKMGPEHFHVKGPLAPGLDTMLYYSIVTFTTLGFGDITPKTNPAAWVVVAEVILGYIMLGGLISILANKLARRS